jgi:hypothetical protein
MGPKGKDEVEFWGKTYTVESPARSSLAKVSTSVMYASSPGVLEMEKGACAHGTCGGSGGCASETLGMCTAGCTGVSIFPPSHDPATSTTRWQDRDGLTFLDRQERAVSVWEDVKGDCYMICVCQYRFSI